MTKKRVLLIAAQPKGDDKYDQPMFHRTSRLSSWLLSLSRRSSLVSLRCFPSPLAAFLFCFDRPIIVVVSFGYTIYLLRAQQLLTINAS